MSTILGSFGKSDEFVPNIFDLKLPEDNFKCSCMDSISIESFVKFVTISFIVLPLTAISPSSSVLDPIEVDTDVSRFVEEIINLVFFA